MSFGDAPDIRRADTRRISCENANFLVGETDRDADRIISCKNKTIFLYSWNFVVPEFARVHNFFLWAEISENGWFLPFYFERRRRNSISVDLCVQLSLRKNAVCAMMNLSERTEIRREMEADRRGKQKKKLNCADFGKWEDMK